MTLSQDLTKARQQADQLDATDGLSGFRSQFHIPRHADEAVVYFCGNSLGLQPKKTEEAMQLEMQKWQQDAVNGHFSGDFPWMTYHEFLQETGADLVGAKPSEVVYMNSLTANLHFLMASFYRPQGQKRKILIEDHAFPSDHYAAASQVAWHGYHAETDLLLLKPREGEVTLQTEDILKTIERNADELALILLPGVQYYTGQVLDMEAITKKAQQYAIPVGFDLAHAAGNIDMALHDWGVDFAAWCSYKYLNSGPGAVAGAFVHEKHHDKDLPRLQGWWGHEKTSRFDMDNQFKPAPGADAWQLSNPPILSLAAVRASLEVFKEAGGMKTLTAKSKQLTSFLRQMLEDCCGDKVQILTPEDAQGCQLSLVIKSDKPGKAVYQALTDAGIVVDWREPDVIRVAPTPLYNSFLDAYRFVETLVAEL
ncbi:kynureninase [Marinicella gelatinilytica]|uniref:kynureninase n=1 Tax=Marinicella gelatinilytica TaxID=2996017 RepID=UPI0022609781|nr:kynureninase [Marinicella gelatinilytica]MCX7545411.1 kynureninase [Marinicella gelatinilytica]